MFLLIFLFFCGAMAYLAFALKSKIKKGIFVVAFFVYIYGGIATNKAVRKACTHGNCKHGWYSKNTQAEQMIAILWGLTPIGLLFLLSDKDFEGLRKK